MSLGLTNAPAYFMHLMNKVFMEYLNKFVVVLIDHILIFSKTKEDHETHLRLVLENSEHINYMPSSTNVNFGYQKLLFLGMSYQLEEFQWISVT
jgi:hypothetical protein